MKGLPAEMVARLSAAEAYEHERREAHWHRAVERALAVYQRGVPGDRCAKCRYPRSDRRRPARHHRACPLHGAGTWRGVLRLVRAALEGRWRMASSVYLDSDVPPHVLGWTLCRVLELAPAAAKHVRAPVSVQALVDHALDRWCGGLGFPAEVPIEVAVAAVGAPLGSRPPVCHRGGLDVYPMTREEEKRPILRVYVVPGAPMSFAPGPAIARSSVRVITLEALLFRAPDRQGEVRVYAERGVAEDELAAVAEAVIGLARVDVFPAHPRLRALAGWARARADVAHRCRVELPDQRRERLVREERSLRARDAAQTWERMRRFGLGAPMYL